MDARHVRMQLGGWAVLGFALLAALAALAPAVWGQELARPKSGPQAWNGSTKQLDGKVHFVGAPDSAELEEILNRAEVAYLVDRDFGQAEEGLRVAQVVGSFVDGFQGQRELLVEVALALSAMEEARGDVSAALSALDGLLPDRSELELEDGSRLAPYLDNLVPAPDRLRQVAGDARGDPRLAARRAELRGRLGQEAPGNELAREMSLPVLEGARAYLAEHFGTASESVMSSVAHSTWRGTPGRDLKLVHQLGKRAAPALARYAVIVPPVGQAVGPVDPLAVLVDVDEYRGSRFVLDFIDVGGERWRGRALEILQDQDLLTGNWTWTPAESDSTPPRCRNPLWLEILAHLLADPTTRRGAMQVVPFVAKLDALTPALQDALAALVRSGDPSQVSDVLFAVSTEHRLASAKPVFEAVLARPEADLRVSAAEKLVRYERSAALMAHAKDEVAEVRVAVARSLAPRTVRTARYVNTVYPDPIRSVSIDPALGDAERTILAGLVADPSPAVRIRAARAVLALAQPLGDEVYERLAADPDPEVRVELAELEHPDVALRARILETLAGDEDPDVLRALDTVLFKADWFTEVETLLPALRRRYFDRGYPFGGRISNAEVARSSLLQSSVCGTEAGILALVRWGVEEDDGHLVETAFDAARNGTKTYALLTLGDEDFARLFAWAQRRGQRNLRQAVLELAELDGAPIGALHLVVADRTVPRPARLVAARLAAPAGGEELESALLALLRDPTWSERGIGASELELLGEIQLPSGAHNAFLERVLADPAVEDRVAQGILVTYAPHAPLGKELTKAVLARWLREDGPGVIAVELAIEHLGSWPPEEVEPDLLKRAVRHPDYVHPAIDSMARLRSEAFLPVLRECLLGIQMPPVSLVFVQEDAARAVAGYLSDDAAEILLEGLGAAVLPRVTDVITNGLERIRFVQEERRRWEEGGDRLPSRETATAQLVRYLEEGGEAQRVEAARGLATLGAVEAIPLLIGYLEDDSDAVREAVRSALDALHAQAATGGEAER